MNTEDINKLKAFNEKVEKIADSMRELSRLWTEQDFESEELVAAISKNYPFEHCFHEETLGVRAWYKSIVAEIKDAEKLPEIAGEHPDMIELLRMLEMEDYDLEISYACPQWNIVINDDWLVCNQCDGTILIHEKGMTDHTWSITASGVERAFAEILKLG